MIHVNVAFADYCSWPQLNVSTLVRGFVRDGRRDVFSPPHLLAAIEGRMPRVDSKATHLGHAIHARLLEPERYAGEYLIAKPCVAAIKSGDRKGAPCGNEPSLLYDGRWYCRIRGHAPDGAIEPAEYVSEELAAKVERIASEMHAHGAVKLLRATGGFEQSATTTLEGVPVKLRVDKDIPKPPGTFPPSIVDIKTCAEGRFTNGSFMAQAQRLFYGERMAFYCKAMESIDGIKRKAVWTIIETSEPHSISVRMCPDSWLEWSWRRVQSALRIYRECKESGQWPSPWSDLQTFDDPWFLNEEQP